MPARPKVLITDDDDLTRATFEEAIIDAGAECLQAQDGNEALDLLAREPSIALVFIDLVMPDKEGIETIREVQVQYPQTKIVAISGHSDYLLLARSMKVMDTIEKPCDIGNLTEKIRNYLT